MVMASVGDKTPLDALAEMWGPRDFARRTNGAPQRTRFLAALWAICKDARDLDKQAGRLADKPFCAMPELEHYAWWLATCWAGEYGWDTDRLVGGIQAASSQTTINQAAPEARRDA